MRGELAVRVQHDDQRDVLEVVTLGDHLRADQDVDVAAMDGVEGIGGGILAPR